MRLNNFWRFNGIKISKNYAVDWNFFWKSREFKDGITNNFDCSLDLFKDDHNPKFRLSLELFNYVVNKGKI